jgi:magnesium-transporting ATPase (P-type)
MQEQRYLLTTILKSVFIYNGSTLKKRLIYDRGLLGGLASRWIKLLFLLLPVILYGVIFNPIVFEMLGIAQAIVFYIILLVFVMQVVMLISYLNNRKLIKEVTLSWEHYFPDIDFKLILSSGTNPYMDFKKQYAKALQEGLDEEMLHKRLLEDVKTMESEHHLLYEAMQREKMKQKG